MQFTRPGFSTLTITDDEIQAAKEGELSGLYRDKLSRLNRESAELNVAHRLAEAKWQQEAVAKAESLEITADEYARQARQGLLAEHLAKNADNYAARATTDVQKNHAAALYRTAAKAVRELS